MIILKIFCDVFIVYTKQLKMCLKSYNAISLLLDLFYIKYNTTSEIKYSNFDDKFQYFSPKNI